MGCPKCKSSQKKKNGFRRGKQSFRCKNCGCQYVENLVSKAYPVEVKKLCLKMYLNGMGFRAIARVTEIDTQPSSIGSKRWENHYLMNHKIRYTSNLVFKHYAITNAEKTKQGNLKKIDPNFKSVIS